jgi:mannose-6-phosphate isomerase
MPAERLERRLVGKVWGRRDVPDWLGSEAALREAALDGRIEQLIDWRPVKAGDVLYSSAGTIHALGAGLTVIEIQQNLDLTYRLYDYGRPRELHLAEGLAAADPSPWTWDYAPRSITRGRELLVEGPAFVVERWSGAEALIGADGPAPAWLIPIAPGSSADGEPLEPGTVWTARGPTRLRVPDSSELLLAYAGSELRFT